MKQLALVVVALTLVSSPAFAAKHCIGKNKAELSVSGNTNKARAASCKAAGGKWVTVKKASAAK
jgi:hypothetical protein